MQLDESLRTAMNPKTLNAGLDFAVLFLQDLGLDLTDPEYAHTPQRWLRYLMDLTCQVFQEPPVMKSFPSSNDEMIIVDPISFYSLCPHHLALVTGVAYVGYVPHGRVYGLSKIPRLVRWLAGYPIKQEDLTVEIANALHRPLAAEDAPPKGIAVVIRASHACMTTRGVKVDSNCRVQTSKMTGCFLDPNKQARAEFLALTKD